MFHLESNASSLALLHLIDQPRLEHPGVVPVYGMGTYANGRPFYAMRFIKGQTLGDAMKSLGATNAAEIERAAKTGGTLLARRAPNYPDWLANVPAAPPAAPPPSSPPAWKWARD